MPYATSPEIPAFKTLISNCPSDTPQAANSVGPRGRLKRGVLGADAVIGFR